MYWAVLKSLRILRRLSRGNSFLQLTHNLVLVLSTSLTSPFPRVGNCVFHYASTSSASSSSSSTCGLTAPAAAALMSIFQPVSLAARRTFCPPLPIARLN